MLPKCLLSDVASVPLPALAFTGFLAGFAAHPASAQQSVIQVSTSVPYATIRTIAVAKLPPQFDFSGNGHLACANVPHFVGGHIGSHRQCALGVCVNVPDVTAPSLTTQSACADYHWNATVRREGDPVVSGAGQALHIEVPIRVDGSAGVGGDLAKIVSLSGKSFEAHARPGVDVSVALDANWCPVIHATPTATNWVSSARVEAIGRNCVGFDFGKLGHPQVCAGPLDVDLDKEANNSVGSLKGTVKDSIEHAASCDTVRKSVTPYWKTFPVTIAGLPGGQGYLNVTPQSAMLSALTPETAALRLTGGVSATTALSATPIAVRQLDLPQLKLASQPTDGLQLSLSVPVGFALINQAAGSLLQSEKFTQSTPLGPIVASVADIRITGSSGALVVGVKLAATLAGTPITLPDWVNVSANPTIAPGTTQLALKNLQVDLGTQDPTMKALGSVLQNQILVRISSPLPVLDLKPELDNLSKQIQAAVNFFAAPGIAFTAGQPQVTPTGLGVSDTALTVSANVAVPFTIALTQDFLASR